MAEEDKTNEDENQDEQLAQVQNFIKDQVREAMREFTPKPEDKLPDDEPKEDAAQRQLREVINPFIEPGLNEAKLQSADAKDFVSFYMSNPDAAEFKDKIEKTFEALAQAGRATNRDSIYKYVLGEEARNDPEAFVAKLNAKKQQQVNSAQGAEDFGSSALNKAHSDPRFTNFSSKTVEEMEQALEGITF